MILEVWRQLTRPVGAWGLAALAAVLGSQIMGGVLSFVPDGWEWLGNEKMWLWLAVGFVGIELLSRWVLPMAPVRTSRAFRVWVRGLVWGSVVAPYAILVFLVHVATLAILNARMGVHEPATLLDSLRCFLGQSVGY